MRHLYLAPLLLLAFSACGSDESSAPPEEQESAPSGSVPAPASVKNEVNDSGDTDILSSDALQERDNPRRVLAYVKAAIDAHRLADAALAWRSEAEMTGATLTEQLGDYPDMELDYGEGEEEGAAGTLYYQVPVTLTADEGSVNRKGIITLSRVNDVPGASEEQLAWRVRDLHFDQ
ncbi:hypothetical protein D6851_05085 [Altericroceibacterium spongiae]|uniref:Lipoprotein n=1 Tax=Altericroceibacterium spongiae TaxID=2320269 RepID=A0A420EPI6_9SPHN|nr:hypothetical protein [Altericroceibacterium spongiae]RKF22595.1 hypothetical protein D6851_05085 [Altericroceibacterium spongiae]